MLRKHASRYGNEWDHYLYGVLWAYRNTPHESTGEKPSFLLYGRDLRSPVEAELLTTEHQPPLTAEDYREQLVQTLASSRQLAETTIRKAQKRYKGQFDRRAQQRHYRVGDWVMVKFPQEEQGKMRKLSHPWHGPYRVVERSDPDLSVLKVYYPQEGTIQVHQERICFCPPELPVGYFWYGTRRHSVGRPPRWVQNLLQKGTAESLVDPGPPGPAESRVEPDPSEGAAESLVEPGLQGPAESQVEPDPPGGAAESHRDVDPAPTLTDVSSSDPVEVSAESRRGVEPDTRAGASECGPVLVDESTEEPTSFPFDYSLPTGDQTGDDDSPRDRDDSLSTSMDPSSDGDGLQSYSEDSRKNEPERIVELAADLRPRPDGKYLLRRQVQPPSRLMSLMCVNPCPARGRASHNGGE